MEKTSLVPQLVLSKLLIELNCLQIDTYKPIILYEKGVQIGHKHLDRNCCTY